MPHRPGTGPPRGGPGLALDKAGQRSPPDRSTIGVGGSGRLWVRGQSCKLTGCEAAINGKSFPPVTRQDDGALVVTGLDAAAIGDLAAADGIAVHALVPR
ncbi:MAG TPA: hypothetical protein VFX25_18500 [Streptosporangiaceae bacterium]|nr:hypothetical protein [Streptosporangiaceae bacterium]